MRLAKFRPNANRPIAAIHCVLRGNYGHPYNRQDHHQEKRKAGHALPPREGICWVLAVTNDLNPNLRGGVTDLVSAWVREPQEGTRQKLMKHMETMKSDTPLYWLSAAVAWNGSGGIGAPEGPVVLPPAWLHAKALLGTIALQMGQDEEEVDRARAVALIRGIEVANGGWPTVSENTG